MAITKRRPARIPHARQIFPIYQRKTSLSSPEFCPNPHCDYHDRETAAQEKWFHRDGSHLTQSRGPIQRFRCRSCGKTCSTQTFSIHYWTHRDINFHHLEQMLISCSGQRQIAREMKTTYRLVKNRTQRLARNYLHLYDQAHNDRVLTENCAFDGFETFIRSKYFPCNIHLLVGSQSQSVYGITGSILRRKGVMTTLQKKRREIIDLHWKPVRGSNLLSCRTLFQDMEPAIMRRLEGVDTWWLFTDMHRDYPRALKGIPSIKKALDDKKICHKTTSSRVSRTAQNDLFPVNYMDRQLRKNTADHVRKTVRQAREINMAMARTLIQCGWHTFRKPYRIPDKADIEATLKHGEAARLIGGGIKRRALERLYTGRDPWSHQKCQMKWMRQIWLNEYENPPIVDFKTGEVKTGIINGKKAKEPGKGWFARHLSA